MRDQGTFYINKLHFIDFQGALLKYRIMQDDPFCDELSQSRCSHANRKRTTCTIGSSIYKNLKLRKEEKGREGSGLADGLI